MHFGGKSRILMIFVDYSLCFLVENRAILMILVGYSPSILVENRAF